MSKPSPTSRSLEHLKAQGYEIVDVVERWNPHARIRQDLWGIVDILAITDTPGLPPVLGVQTTSGSNVAARVRKIQDSPNLPVLRRAGVAIHVHGWRKSAKHGWVLRTEDLS